MDKKLYIFMEHVGDNGEKVEFSSDENGNLYINKKEVVTRDVIKLRWIELLMLIVTTLSVAAQALFAALSYFK